VRLTGAGAAVKIARTHASCYGLLQIYSGAYFYAGKFSLLSSFLLGMVQGRKQLPAQDSALVAAESAGASSSAVKKGTWKLVCRGLDAEHVLWTDH
jgi:hypothetical protein